MEADNRKKKKVTVEGDEGESGSERLKKLKGKDGVAAASGSGDAVAAAVPTEEEVEELYAILRRMKEAVNYFHRKGTGTKEWRHALEKADVTLLHDADNVDDGVAVRNNNNNNTAKDVITNEGFDLNALAPEADDDDHGGA